MSIENNIPTEVEDDLAAGTIFNDSIPAPINDNDFAADFDLFGDDFGGEESGIEDLYRRKFKAGVNEDCRFLGFEWVSEENYKMIKCKFLNDDQWEEAFPMFIPEARTYEKNGKTITSWFPKQMFDVNKQPIEDNSQYRRRAYGGIKVLDENGKVMRNPATKKPIYRNETDEEAKNRQMKDFKIKLNSFLAVFCRTNMREAMTKIASKGRVTGWKDYHERVQDAIMEFCPNFADEPIRLKLHRKYDKSTSNKRSEKYFQLPETMEYGLFMEKMCDPTLSVITTTAYEEKSLIAAPMTQQASSGLQTGAAMPTNMPAGMPMGGAGLPTATSVGMPPINR